MQSFIPIVESKIQGWHNLPLPLPGRKENMPQTGLRNVTLTQCLSHQTYMNHSGLTVMQDPASKLNERAFKLSKK